VAVEAPSSAAAGARAQHFGALVGSDGEAASCGGSPADEAPVADGKRRLSGVMDAAAEQLGAALTLAGAADAPAGAAAEAAAAAAPGSAEPGSAERGGERRGAVARAAGAAAAAAGGTGGGPGAAAAGPPAQALAAGGGGGRGDGAGPGAGAGAQEDTPPGYVPRARAMPYMDKKLKALQARRRAPRHRRPQAGMPPGLSLGLLSLSCGTTLSLSAALKIRRRHVIGEARTPGAAPGLPARRR